MADVHFYEKPGCINNTRQKELLQQAGHKLQLHNLLECDWDKNELRLFFRQLPVSEWFNPSAPAIKEAWVDPKGVDAETALNLMLKDPLLIRRPLMRVGDQYRAGFDTAMVDAWIGLDDIKPTEDIQTCPRKR